MHQYVGKRRVSFPQRRAPLSILLQNLVPRAALAVDNPCAVAVFVNNFIGRYDELPVPCGLRGRRWPSAARRVRETDTFRTIEHDDIDVITEMPVVEWVAESQRRQIPVQRLPRTRSDFELEFVREMYY